MMEWRNFVLQHDAAALLLVVVVRGSGELVPPNFFSFKHYANSYCMEINYLTVSSFHPTSELSGPLARSGVEVFVWH